MHIASHQSHSFYTLLICSLLFVECIGIPTTEGSLTGNFIHLIDRRVGKMSQTITDTTTSICLMKRDNGTCSDKVQRFSFDATIGECVGFVYTGCGGNENRFETRKQCEKQCMSGSKHSPCANGYSNRRPWMGFNGNSNCSKRRCDDGFICVTDERSISQCCNQTVEQLYAEARASFCTGGKRALRSVIHSEVLFAKECDDLLCTDGFECVQINKLFAKCCQREQVVQMPSAMPLSAIKSENDTGSELISRRQVKLRSPWIDNNYIKSPCLMPKHEGNCRNESDRMAQLFYYDPDWQSCFAFKYTGCGGNANRFITRDDCEFKCLYADGSVCKGPLPSIEPSTQDPPCVDSICPQGYTCSHGFGYMECCNSTIQRYVKEAYSSTCPDGSLADGINDDHFMATFAKSCSDLICESPRRCVQVSPHFAKCCGLTPIPPQSHAQPKVENDHGSHGSPLDVSSETLSVNGTESNKGMAIFDENSMPYAK